MNFSGNKLQSRRLKERGDRTFEQKGIRTRNSKLERRRFKELTVKKLMG